MAFSGYLMRKPGTNVYFPEKYMVYGSYETTPNQRQDKDPLRDMDGILHRAVVSGKPSRIKFSVRDGLHLAQKAEVQAFFTACTLEASERKVRIQFWNDETNDYQIETFYLPDITYQILYHTDNDIIYSGVDYELIGYGY